MNAKIGRNEPCPCGSGKKYKQCCQKKHKPASRRRFKATVLSSKGQDQQSSKEENHALENGPDLIMRTYADKKPDDEEQTT